VNSAKFDDSLHSARRHRISDIVFRAESISPSDI
jgi:hypothetical protein